MRATALFALTMFAWFLPTVSQARDGPDPFLTAQARAAMNNGPAISLDVIASKRTFFRGEMIALTSEMERRMTPDGAVTLEFSRALDRLHRVR